MKENDLNQVNQIIDLSFPIFYRFFAVHSLHEEGQVIIGEIAGRVVGFAKLINFYIGGKKYGCILWIAVHPSFRRKGIAGSITSNGIQRLKQEGSNAVFASTARRNVVALSVLSLQGFRRMSFFGLRRFFGWQVFKFYSDIWLAPGEIVLMHN
jgi:ribosomal protein S18 acetylase RimI-like enzyme